MSVCGCVCGKCCFDNPQKKRAGWPTKKKKKKDKMSYICQKQFRFQMNYYRKRGSASYIVREVLSVRERERYRERETEVTSPLSR